MDFIALAQQCAPSVHQDTMRRIAHVESSFNPYAIGVVNGRLDRQPRNLAEAIATAQDLESRGFNYSVGIIQVNKKNFGKYGLTLASAFDACQNLRAGGEILKECFLRSKAKRNDDQQALKDSFSCYYSGNFLTGYKHGYVLKVVSANGSAGSGGGARIVAQASPSRSKPMAQPRREPEALENDGIPPEKEGNTSALLF
jgi:type IV secretion system protein VirB1